MRLPSPRKPPVTRRCLSPCPRAPCTCPQQTRITQHRTHAAHPAKTEFLGTRPHLSRLCTPASPDHTSPSGGTHDIFLGQVGERGLELSKLTVSVRHQKQWGYILHKKPGVDSALPLSSAALSPGLQRARLPLELEGEPASFLQEHPVPLRPTRLRNIQPH